MTAVFVYALECPFSGAVRYIGKANDPASRLRSHFRDCLRRNTPVYRWMRPLLAAGTPPVMRVLVVTDDAHWADVERELIAQYRAQEFGLLNLADGGDQPFATAANRANAGRRAVEARERTPSSKRIWALKRKMGAALQHLKANNRVAKYEEIAGKLRLAAQKNPRLFSVWASL